MLFTQKLFQDFVAGFDTLGYAPGTPAPAGGLAFLLGGKFRQVFCDSLDLPTTFGPRIWTTEKKYILNLNIKWLFSTECNTGPPKTTKTPHTVILEYFNITE